MNKQKSNQYKGLALKIGITWLCIFLLAGFFVAMKTNASPITMSIIPEVPKAGEPIVATFNMSNSTDEPSTTSYQLYVNGRLVESGSITVAPQTSSKHQYAYTNPLERGQQVNFVLETSSDSGSFVRAVSLPAYPPQLMSSFVSFAAFSTSVMSSMISSEYFTNTFGTTSGINTGIIISIILIALLVFLELTQAITTGKGITILSSYRVGLGNMTSILFIIFVGMVFTRVVMILTT
ncbi:hypothetical protein ACFLXU_01990 [Chloroflexota bacterium]